MRSPEDTGLASYQEIVTILEHLPLLLRERRRGLGVSMKAVANEIGCGASTLSVVEACTRVPSLDTVILILGWLARQEREAKLNERRRAESGRLPSYAVAPVTNYTPVVAPRS